MRDRIFWKQVCGTLKEDPVIYLKQIGVDETYPIL